jgi:TonB family protein
MKWLALVIVATVLKGHSLDAASVWSSAPKPNFPQSSLRKGSEGFVKLRIIVAKDGHVTNAVITKSSGDGVLDNTARNAVFKWKMNTAVIKPDYLTKGIDA